MEGYKIPIVKNIKELEKLLKVLTKIGLIK